MTTGAGSASTLQIQCVRRHGRGLPETRLGGPALLGGPGGVGAENFQIAGVGRQCLQRLLDTRIGDVALQIDVKLVLPRRMGPRPGFEFGQVDVVLGQHVEAAHQGPFLVPGRKQDAGFARNPRVDLQRIAGHHDETGEVFLLIGDAAFQDFQAVNPGRLFAGDGGLRQVLVVAHLAGALAVSAIDSMWQCLSVRKTSVHCSIALVWE